MQLMLRSVLKVNVSEAFTICDRREFQLVIFDSIHKAMDRWLFPLISPFDLVMLLLKVKVLCKWNAN